MHLPTNSSDLIHTHRVRELRGNKRYQAQIYNLVNVRLTDRGKKEIKLQYRLLSPHAYRERKKTLIQPLSGSFAIVDAHVEILWFTIFTTRSEAVKKLFNHIRLYFGS